MPTRFAMTAWLTIVLVTSSWAQAPSTKIPESTVAPNVQSESDQLNKRGAAAMRQGDFPSAIQSYRRLAQLAPAVAEIHGNLCFAYYSAGRFQEALPPCRQALKLKPTLTSPRYFLALSLAQTGGCAEALELITKDRARVQDAQLRYIMDLSAVRCAMATGQADRAVDFLRLLGRDSPDDSQFLYLSALVYSDLSTRASQRLLQTAPGSIEAHQFNAEVLESQARIEDAKGEYRKILAMNPGLPGIHQRMGRLLLMGEMTVENREEARREFERELQLDPANALAEYELGEMARQERRWSEAITRFRKATELDPTLADALVGLGKSLISAGRAEEAVAPLERAVKIAPASAAAHYQLSFAYRRLGREDDAKREITLYQASHEEEQKLRQAIRTGIQGAISQPQTAEAPE